MSAETPTWAGPFHRREIPRGIYGQVSKVEEERQEALDAIEQGQRLMYCVELSDMLGALEGTLSAQGSGVLEAMAIISEREDVERPASDVTRDQLEWIGELLELAGAGGEHAVGYLIQAVECVGRLGIEEGFTFDDLWRFAQLRSAVARHALGLESL